jgi:hypothetical protein
VADAMKPLRQNVEQEAPDELVGSEFPHGGTDGSQTRRWRKPDSNPRSPATRGNVSRLPVGLWVTNRYR